MSMSAGDKVKNSYRDTFNKLPNHHQRLYSLFVDTAGCVRHLLPRRLRGIREMDLRVKWQLHIYLVGVGSKFNKLLS